MVCRRPPRQGGLPASEGSLGPLRWSHHRMDFSLTNEQQRLRTTSSALRESVEPRVADRDRAQTFSRELWRKCGEMGIQGLPAPEEYGGSGLDPLSTAVASKRSATAATMGPGLLAVRSPPLLRRASLDARHRRPEAPIPARTVQRHPGWRSCHDRAWLRSDAFGLRTKAEPAGGGHRINGVRCLFPMDRSPTW